VTADIPCDLQGPDPDGHLWAFLDEAADPSVVVEGALVITGDEEALVTARVRRLEKRPGGTMVVMEIVDPGPGTPSPTS
jgi:hypothetical protein